MPLPIQDNSRDRAQVAIAEALRLIGQSDEKVEKHPQLAELMAKTLETDDQGEAPSVGSVEPSWRSTHLSRSFAAVLAFGCIGVALLAWHSSQGQVTPEPISTSSISQSPRKPTPTKLAKDQPQLAAKATALSPQALPLAPQDAPIPPQAAPMAADLAPQVHMIARDLASLEQGIDQLKVTQSQMVSGNADLAKQLAATQEVVRHTADLIEDLKSAEAQTVREYSKLTEELKESRDRMASMADRLKESQEQVVGLIASLQKQRPARPTTSPVANVNATARPVTAPPSALVRGQTQAHIPKQ